MLDEMPTGCYFAFFEHPFSLVSVTPDVENDY